MKMRTTMRPPTGMIAKGPHRYARLALGLAASTGMVLCRGSATAATTDPARTVDAILADHVIALGGKDALTKHKSLHIKRKITIKGMGIEGEEERFGATGDRFLATTSIPGIGMVRQGSDGKTFWSDDPINGLRLLAGPEREQARLDGSWNAELRLTKLYKKVTVVPPPANAPKAGPGGAGLECLEMVPAEGSPLVVCFDAKSHQRVFQTGRQMTPQGEMPFEAHFSAWQTFAGVSLPTIEQTTAGPTSIEARVTDVKFDEKLDPGLFKLKKPAAGKAMKPIAAKPAPAAGAEPKPALPASPPAGTAP
jgi:hypothetical protein